LLDTPQLFPEICIILVVEVDMLSAMPIIQQTLAQNFALTLRIIMPVAL